MTTVDLNADLGERSGSWRRGDDDAILRVVTTTHIACGFHAGDPTTMRETVDSAVRHGVTIGAHPSYPDREGFGRRPLEVGLEQIRDDLIYQVAALDGIARSAGARVRSVKPHGALYNRMATDQDCALAVAEAIRELDPSLWLVVLAGTPGAQVAGSRGLRVAEEAFCDRGYDADGTLLAREAQGALIVDPAEAARRAVRLVRDHVVETAHGQTVAIVPSTLCVHGDTPGAPMLALAVREGLEAAGFVVASSQVP